MMKRIDRAKRVRRILSAAGFALALLMFVTAFCVFISTMRAKRENRTPTFFGYSFSIVVTGSMEPEIRVGELLIVKPVCRPYIPCNVVIDGRGYDNTRFRCRCPAAALCLLVSNDGRAYPCRVKAQTTHCRRFHANASALQVCLRLC